MESPRPWRTTMARYAVGLSLVLLISSSCGTDGPERELHVFAAASLGDVFAELETTFESHYDADVRINLLGSSELALQIEQGGPADVFAAADAENMQRLQEQGLIDGAPVAFAENAMTVVVEPGNPLDIDGVGDLVDDDLVVSLAAPGVPAGNYTRAVLAKAGVEVSPDSQEQDVRAVLTRVASGEADAGIVYQSDALNEGDVDPVRIPPDLNVVARYFIATVADAREPSLARAFVDLVLSEDGRSALRAEGFSTP